MYYIDLNPKRAGKVKKPKNINGHPNSTSYFIGNPDWVIQKHAELAREVKEKHSA